MHHTISTSIDEQSLCDVWMFSCLFFSQKECLLTCPVQAYQMKGSQIEISAAWRQSRLSNTCTAHSKVLSQEGKGRGRMLSRVSTLLHYRSNLFLIFGEDNLTVLGGTKYVSLGLIMVLLVLPDCCPGSNFDDSIACFKQKTYLGLNVPHIFFNQVQTPS